MPLHLGKIAASIAILTITAFLLWLMFGSLLTGETAVKPGASLTPPAGSVLGSSLGVASGDQEQGVGAEAA